MIHIYRSSARAGKVQHFFKSSLTFLLIPPDFTTDLTAVPQGLAQVQQFSKAARAE